MQAPAAPPGHRERANFFPETPPLALLIANPVSRMFVTANMKKLSETTLGNGPRAGTRGRASCSPTPAPCSPESAFAALSLLSCVLVAC